MNFVENQLDDDIYACIQNYIQSETFSHLQEETQKEYNLAISKDEKLEEFLSVTLEADISEWAKKINWQTKTVILIAVYSKEAC